MTVWFEVDAPTIDMAEIYRQDYMDARDMVNDLTRENTLLCKEIELLHALLETAENHIAEDEGKWYELERNAIIKKFETS